MDELETFDAKQKQQSYDKNNKNSDQRRTASTTTMNARPSSGRREHLYQLEEKTNCEKLNHAKVLCQQYNHQQQTPIMASCEPLGLAKGADETVVPQRRYNDIIEVHPIAIEVLRDSVDPPGYYDVDNKSILPPQDLVSLVPQEYSYYNNNNNNSTAPSKQDCIKPIRRHELKNMKRLLSTPPESTSSSNSSSRRSLLLQKKEISIRSFASSKSNSSSRNNEIVDLYRDPENPSHMIEIYRDKRGRKTKRVHKPPPKNMNLLQKLGFQSCSSTKNDKNFRRDHHVYDLDKEIPAEYANLDIEI